MAVLAETQAKC